MTDSLDPLRRMDVEAAKRITGRECGDCSLYCCQRRFDFRLKAPI
jgi:hypothetical protein